MSRYDLSRASNAALLALTRALTTDEAVAPDGTISPVLRRCLVAFAQELIDDPGESFVQLEALRAECRVKTRAEFDREIGDKARASLQSGEWDTDPFWLKGLRALVDQSRSAPEGEP